MSTTMTRTMLEPTFCSSPSVTNGNGRLAEEHRQAAPARRRWPQIEWTFNEWTFSLALFAFSLAVVLGKLYVNYGTPLPRQVGARFSSSMATRVYEAIPSISVLPKFEQLSVGSERLLNADNQYAEAAIHGLMAFYEKYIWLLKAMTSGLVLTGFTWFILYMDSSIPGVNPPAPFSPSKQRLREGSRIQMNYLVGALNGIVCFVLYLWL
ncbi:PREDICTED: uncharacterized protein LOC105561852 [Vollenhovia emeryi]|uniref:uncharacterized protein LOC105561852 n=1 Tax=Vollenhovia emeryi TaxID=411798 RepID=UPI0005F493C2|nr:PREDICTED: uncharacterized protein LOC105561852 [Vollenhovia emeryi]